MLHPVNRPECIDALWLAVFIQEELLKLGLTANPTDKANLSRIFGQETVNWLLRYKDDLIIGLNDYFHHPVTGDKLAILEAFRHDITYHEHFTDPGFVFHFQPKQNLPCGLSVSVGQWLEKFYDVVTSVKKGFPSIVTGFSSDINGQVIYLETLEKNPSLNVCPACDGTWMERTSTGVLGSIDHFLPRSCYPALSVHPVNLLPICSTCNEKIKKNKDPLSEVHTRTLPETFHSYFRPARSIIQVQIGASWTIVDNGVCTQNQLLLFPDVFDLPGRWQKDADEFDKRIRRRIRGSVDSFRDAGGALNQDSFERLLTKLDTRLYDEWGEDGNSFPVTWYFRWLCQNKKAELIHDYVN
jgi:hypothetical protein